MIPKCKQINSNITTLDSNKQTKPTVLYNNSSGTTGTVTLSETSANFSYLEIFFGKGTSTLNSVKVDSPNGKSVALVTGYRISPLTQITTRYVRISGTSITNVSGSGGGTNFYSDSFGSYDTIEVSILKIIGWK